MKSLSDYTKILRDIATNLNLQGESVEMVTQMLANALYISEVEHVAYSQEASLERATLQNSKIQHCVNQMYSVYRGANPRVLLNFRATKLFTFQPHQEIIKSNNYQVYYIGYFNEDTGTIQYSDLTMYPDTTKTIIGIMAKEVVTDTWTVDSENPYYRTIPISDLSGDLYLDVAGTRTEVTRVFSDHLRRDIPFDLTIPGYGLRLYYQESLQGDSGINVGYSLSVYKMLHLSDILESEQRALKMTGSVLVPFSSRTLKALGAEESYPGLIFIPDTPHDAIDTVHLKANRNRYSGTYMATNSDLSWLLQEYYPSKIRRGGVTYLFESPSSTSRQTMTTSREVTVRPGSFLGLKNLEGTLRDWVSLGDGYLPAGTLKFRYKKSKLPVGTNSSFEILPSSSVIPVRTSFVPGGEQSYLSPTVPELTIRVLKDKSKILTTGRELAAEGLGITYLFPDRMSSPGTLGEGTLKITDIERYVSSTSDRPLEINLTFQGKTVDTEIIPFSYIPVTLGKVEVSPDESYLTFTEEGPGDYYTLDLQEDTIYLKTDLSGAVSEPTETSATLFGNGKVLQGVTYSLLPSSDIEATIDSVTGVIRVIELSSPVATLIVKARYNGITFQSLLTCRKTITNYDISGEEVKFSIYSDLEGEKYPLGTWKATPEESEVVLEIPPRKYKTLSLEASSSEILFSDSLYTYTWDVMKNLIPEGAQTTPSLHLYYIPYSGSNPLDPDEISRFIQTNKSYYITQDISISAGQAVVAKFDISLDLYRNTSLDESILEILQRYGYRFGIDLSESSETYPEIKSLITKISEVKNVGGMKITYLSPTSREEISEEEVKGSDIPVYYIVECVISSIVRS